MAFKRHPMHAPQGTMLESLESWHRRAYKGNHRHVDRKRVKRTFWHRLRMLAKKWDRPA